MKIKTVKMIDSEDWDKVIKNTYGKPYCLQQQGDYQDRSNYEIIIPDNEAYDFENDTLSEDLNEVKTGVSFKAWLETDPEKTMGGEEIDIKLWWWRNFYPSLQMVANDLYKKELIKRGKYFINIEL